MKERESINGEGLKQARDSRFCVRNNVDIDTADLGVPFSWGRMQGMGMRREARFHKSRRIFSLTCL